MSPRTEKVYLLVALKRPCCPARPQPAACSVDVFSAAGPARLALGLLEAACDSVDEGSGSYRNGTSSRSGRQFLCLATRA